MINQSAFRFITKMLMFTILCVGFSVANARSLGRETDACITEYLKNASLINIDEDAIGATPLSPKCEFIVEDYKEKIMNGTRKWIMSDSEMADEETCILATLKKSDYQDMILLSHVYQNPLIIDDDARLEKLEVIRTQIIRSGIKAFITCESPRKFGEIFDDFFGDDTNESDDDFSSEDFCIRKRINENKLIAIHDVHLEANPKNLDASTIDCEALIQKSVKEAEGDLLKMLQGDDPSEIEAIETTCLLKIVREGNYLDQLIQFDYVRELKLSETMKNDMRDKFVKIMTRLAKSSTKCL